LDIIRDVRYREVEYFFIHDFDGVMIMHAVRPDLMVKTCGICRIPTANICSRNWRQQPARPKVPALSSITGRAPGQEEPIHKISYAPPSNPGVGWSAPAFTPTTCGIIDRKGGPVCRDRRPYHLLGAVAGWWIGRSISGPDRAITATMQELADGNTDLTVPARDEAHEIGAMANAVEVFRENAIKQAEMAGVVEGNANQQMPRQARIEELIAGSALGFRRSRQRGRTRC
jgi:HAMP domain-containing protein